MSILKLSEADFLALQSELLKLKEETYEAKNAAKKSTDEVERLKKDNTAKDKLLHEKAMLVEALKDNIKELVSAVKPSMADSGGLELVSSFDLLSQIAVYEQNEKLLLAQIEELQQRRDPTSSSSISSDLLSAISPFEQDLMVAKVAFESELSALHKKIEDLESQIQQKDLQQKLLVGRLEDELITAQAELAATTSIYESKANELDGLRSKLDALIIDHDKARQDLNDAQEAYVHVSEQLQESEAARVIAESSLTESRSFAETKELALLQCREEVVSLRSDLQMAEESLVEKIKLNSSLEASNLDLTQQLAVARLHLAEDSEWLELAKKYCRHLERTQEELRQTGLILPIDRSMSSPLDKIAQGLASRTF